MTGFLGARGLIIQQSRIRAAMRRTNPEGTLLRALGIHVIQRRSYQVAGPLALWHVDSNHISLGVESGLIRVGLHDKNDHCTRIANYASGVIIK